jgi:hypothetical protein
MSHLTLETLARLIDDAPDPTETGHLDICEACRTELEALRSDAAALRALPDPEPPIAAWLALDQRLKREGLMRPRAWAGSLIRMAAVLAIFVVGSLVGALLMTTTRPDVRYAATSPGKGTIPIQRVAASPPAFDTESVKVAPLPSAVMTNPAPARPRTDVRPAATPEEAMSRLRDAELAYLSALGRYADLSGRTAAPDPLARLAALESIVATTRAALGQAPADPVLNGYHLTAVAQRDAMLRQLDASADTWY